MKDPFTVFFQLLTWTGLGKSIDPAPSNIRKIAKFESDLLKTVEDTVPQNCENLQMFVWRGASLSQPLYNK